MAQVSAFAGSALSVAAFLNDAVDCKNAATGCRRIFRGGGIENTGHRSSVRDTLGRSVRGLNTLYAVIEFFFNEYSRVETAW
jgi:hypothetical protein